MIVRTRLVVLAIPLISLLSTPVVLAGDVWVARDSRGRAVLTNLGTQSPGRTPARRVPLGNVSVAAQPGRSAAVPAVSLAGAVRSIDADKRARYVDHVAAAAARYMISPRLIEAVIKVESDFQANAVSRKGAQGLMQLMPETARDLEVVDAFDPAQNIHGGARYLRAMLDQFNQNLNLALAAYNAGPTAVRNAGGVPRIPETVDYVRKVRSFLGHGMLSNSSSSLVARRDGRGRLVVTNLPGSAAVRLTRDRRGVPALSNR